MRDCHGKRKILDILQIGIDVKNTKLPFMYEHESMSLHEKNTLCVKIILIVMKGEHVDDVGTYLSF